MPRPDRLTSRWALLALIAALVGVAGCGVPMTGSAPRNTPRTTAYRTPTPLPTDTPRRTPRPATADTAPTQPATVPATLVPSATATATPTSAPPSPTSTRTPTRRPRTPTPMPTVVWGDARYGLGAGWGCSPSPTLPYYMLGLRWAFSWDFKSTPRSLGMPPGAGLVLSVPDATCAGPERDPNGVCLYTRITTPADFAASPSLTDTVRANPGAYWALGNEPNGRPNRAPRIPPDEYADWYYTMALIVKGNDPSAILLNGGLASLEAAGDTPQDEYAQGFYSTYVAHYGTRPPVDIWNIHVYPDPGRSPQQIVSEFMTWLWTAGEGNYPVWVTEFNDFRRGSTEDSHIAYMHEAIRVFQSFGIQRWFWYIGRDGTINWPHQLWRCDGSLTRVGQEYRDLAHGIIPP